MENDFKKSKIWYWLNTRHEPVVDFDSMSSEQIKAMYKAIMK